MVDVYRERRAGQGCLAWPAPLGERATSLLVALRARLERHYSTISVAVLLLIGVLLGATGLKELIG